MRITLKTQETEDPAPVKETASNASGTLITRDPDSGFPDFMIINAAYGINHTVFRGAVCPDEYRVFKPFINQKDKDPVVEKIAGSKQVSELCTSDPGSPANQVMTDHPHQHHHALTTQQIIALATLAMSAEEHAKVPLEIEWKYHAGSDEFNLTSAEKLTSPLPGRLDPLIVHEIEAGNTHSILQGSAIGSGLVHGEVSLVSDLSDQDSFQVGTILVTRQIDEAWLPLLENASGLITDLGGRACQAATLCRNLKIPAILGTTHATHQLNAAQKITLDCSQPGRGTVWRNHPPLRRSIINTDDVANSRIGRNLSVGSPAEALRWWQLPAEGIGMASIEAIITNDIGVHPMALLRYDEITDEQLRLKIDQLTAPFEFREDFYIDQLARGIARIAAVSFPKPAVIRLNDFTSDRFNHLLDRGIFEPLEDNPKLGRRGVARYLSPDYREAFALECRALNQARYQMGFTNIALAVPFCRSLRGARETLGILQDHGLHRGKDGLEIHLIAEVPSNIVLCHEFMTLFDRLDIDLDTLAQMILSIDPEAPAAGDTFDHADPAVMEALRTLVDEAHRSGRKVTVFGLLKDHRPEIMDYLFGVGIDAFAFEPGNFVRGCHQLTAAERLYDTTTPNNPNTA